MRKKRPETFPNDICTPKMKATIHRKHAKLAIKDLKCKGKGKAIPLQAWTVTEGSRRTRLPDLKKIGT